MVHPREEWIVTIERQIHPSFVCRNENGYFKLIM